MADIEPDKILPALEAEKARRIQAKIDAGECVVQTITVVLHPGEDEEEATARAVARHPAPDDGREVHREFFYIFTGVPRGPDHWKEEDGSPQAAETSAEEPSQPSEVEPAASETACSEPAYVRVTIHNGGEDDPGRIAEGRYTIEDGVVTVRDLDDKYLTARALLKGESPLNVARALLRETEEPEQFNHPIIYPRWGLA